MVESEFNLQRIPEEISPLDSDLAARIINTHFGKVHINEAVKATTFSDGSIHIPGVVEIAVINAAATSMSPNTNREVFLSLRGMINDSGHKKSSIEWGMAHIDALMGNYETAERNVSAFRPEYSGYLLAGRTIASQGEDPTNMLQKAEASMQLQIVEDSTSANTDQFYCYNSLGDIYAQAGFVDEARRSFEIAENLLDSSRNEFNLEFKEALGSRLDDAWVADGYSMLASTYIDVGWYDDAVRLVDKLKEDDNFKVSGLETNIIKNQLDHGLVDDAVELASKFGGILYLKALASKAVIEATQGKPIEETVGQFQKVIEGAEYLGDGKWSVDEIKVLNTVDPKNQVRFSMHSADYAFILSSFGNAEAMVGNFEAAKIQFSKAWEVIKKFDDWLFTPTMIFDLAIAAHDAGFDASEIFTQALDAVETIPKDEDHWDLKWSYLAEMVEKLTDNGYLDLARDALARYNKKGYSRFDATKSKILARLGTVELQNGISSEIPIPVSELQAILASDNEQAKQSIRYLNEQGVLNIS